MLCRDVGLEFRELKDCFSLFHLLRDGHIRFYVAISRAQILLRDWYCAILMLQLHRFLTLCILPSPGLWLSLSWSTFLMFLLALLTISSSDLSHPAFSVFHYKLFLLAKSLLAPIALMSHTYQAGDPHPVLCEPVLSFLKVVETCWQNAMWGGLLPYLFRAFQALTRQGSPSYTTSAYWGPIK